jgi:16S rRNA (adenine(1408)-N(1))-methyltransferase
VLRRARRSPEEAFLGLDADASRMREASQRAARTPQKGGLPNAWFGVAAAEALPRELDGLVHELTVLLPWGSLLRGVLDVEPWFLAGARRLLRPGAELRMLLSVTPRDGLAIAQLDERALTRLVHAYEAACWLVVEAHQATAQDVVASGSSWARRLGIPDRRAAAVLRLLRPTDG